MSKRADLLKSIVKKGVADKATFGTNPKDPWSAKYGISEDAILDKFLLSRGINPKFVAKDTKVSHSKSGEFLKWKQDHQFEEVQLGEATDKTDTITMDIPLLIRMLEYAREDAKTDMALHKVVEKLLKIRKRGILTMRDYNFVTTIREHVELAENEGCYKEVPKDPKEWKKYAQKRSELWRQLQLKMAESAEQLDELSPELQHRYFKAAYAQKNDKTVPKDIRKKRSTGMNKVINRTLRRNTISTPGASQDFKDQEAKRGIGHVRDHVEVGGQQLDEISKEKANEYMWNAKSDRQRTDDQINKEMEKQGSGWSKRRHNKISELLNKSTKRTTGINRALDRLNKEETEVQEGVVDAVKKAWKAVSNFDDPTPKYDGNTKRRQALKDKLAAQKKQKEVSGLDEASFNANAALERAKSDDKKKAQGYEKVGPYTFRKKKPEEKPVEKEVSEAKEANYGGEYQASVLRFKEKAKQKPVDMASLAARMQASYKKDEKKPVKENTMDSLAATQAPYDCANTPDDVAPKDKNKKLIQMSKSARIIKSIYKRKGMKEEVVREELYDHEKEDKSVATYGKKPKMSKTEVKLDLGDTEPKAAAVMSGGTTLTGEKRDTIEIDPMMQRRPAPGQPMSKKVNR